MKKMIVNILLGFCAAAAVLVLVFQGFVIPAVSDTASLWLRLVGAVCCQWLVFRVFEKKLHRAVPLLLGALLAVWGFFLYLSSPSWLGTTFNSFLSDYVSPLFGCLLVWVLAWLLPPLRNILKNLLRVLKRRKKKKTK